MAIIIDNGTFLVGNSFVTAEDAKEFHKTRGNQPWADAKSSERESALIRAFDFLSVQNWKEDAFEDEIPLKVIMAQEIAALKELIDIGTMQPDLQVGIKTEEIDGVVAMEYFEGGNNTGTTFVAIENLIAPYLASSPYFSSRMRLVRGGG